MQTENSLTNRANTTHLRLKIACKEKTQLHMNAKGLLVY